MKQRFPLILFVMLILVIGHNFAQEPSPRPDGNFVIPQSIYVRAGPSIEFIPVGALFLGDTVTPLNISADLAWVLITYNRGFGWIERRLIDWQDQNALVFLPVLEANITPTPRISLTPPTPAFPTATPEGNYVLITDAESAYVRAGPGRGYLRLGYLRPGMLVEPYAQTADGRWIMIRYQDEFMDGFAWIARLLVSWEDNAALDDLPVMSLDNLTPTLTFTPSLTPSFTPTASVTASPTATFTPTATATNTATATETVTASATPTLTATTTASPTLTATATNTASATPTLTATATETASPTPSATLTASASATATLTMTASPSSTATLTATLTASPSATLTVTASPSSTLTLTATLTVTPKPTETFTATASSTNTASPTLTSLTPSVIASESSSATINATAQSIAILTTDAASPSVIASLMPIVTSSATEPSTATFTPTPSPNPSSTVNSSLIAPSSPSAVAIVLPETAIPSETPIALTSDSDNPTQALPFPIEIIVATGLLLLILTYVGLYLQAQGALSRYASGFVVTDCPVCQRGGLHIEERQERSFGIPQVRRTVRCNQCRSVLRQTGTRRWRYAVDRLENTKLYERYNGQIVSDDELERLAKSK